jgi:heme/copper-type cytochrome/quinol oxidase subunit 2
MVAFVRAVSPDRYQQWVERQKRDIDQANADAVKQRSQFNPIPSQ